MSVEDYCYLTMSAQFRRCLSYDAVSLRASPKSNTALSYEFFVIILKKALRAKRMLEPPGDVSVQFRLVDTRQATANGVVVSPREKAEVRETIDLLLSFTILQGGSWVKMMELSSVVGSKNILQSDDTA